MPLFLGLISGTSMDGIDAAVIDVTDARCNLLAFREVPFDGEVRDRLEAVVQSQQVRLDELGILHANLGHEFARAARGVLKEAGLSVASVSAIGSHGQTIVHGAASRPGFSIQIGDPSIIAFETGIVTVADFRSKDVAAGGQGAPLLPGFHEFLFRKPDRDVAVVNIGGIANVSLIDHSRMMPLLGFDCGPGNTLMDLWCYRHSRTRFDQDGVWAASGTVDIALLNGLLLEPYFAGAIPKSTGRELFDLRWLDGHLQRLRKPYKPEDVQATLAALTARVIADSIKRYLPQCGEVVVCGGGAKNAHLVQNIARELKHCAVSITDAQGIPSGAVEACAFAWLAWRRLEHLAGNVPSVTGASSPVILGGVYEPF